MEKDTVQTPPYYPQSEIVNFIDQRYSDIINNGHPSLGTRATSSLRKYIARRSLYGQGLGFELPAEQSAMVKDAESGEVYFHSDYLRFATESDNRIDGLSNPSNSSRRFLTDYVQLHLIDLQ